MDERRRESSIVTAAKAQPKQPTSDRLVLVTGECCPRCENPSFRTVPIHDGESERIDCAKCGSVFGFSKWQGQTLATLKPPGLARNAED